MNIYTAPIQGHTDAAWRHFHQQVYGGKNRYFTPFMRLEHGEARSRDIRDFTNELNAGLDLEPQVIFRNIEELEPLIAALADEGTTRINLNIGCPFPLQTGKGRGAGFIANTEEAARLPETLSHWPGISFSLKMRLGFADPEEWRGIIDTLNSLDLRFVALHPRVARQQYGGEVDMAQFEEFLKASKNPVIYNGDLRTPTDVAKIAQQFPDIEGVMLGRGLLGRPSLAAEVAEGKEWSHEQRIESMKKFHRRLLNHYEETLQGDSQVLSKIKPFWEYAEDEIGRKAWKAIKKATNIPKYHSALPLISAD